MANMDLQFLNVELKFFYRPDLCEHSPCTADDYINFQWACFASGRPAQTSRVPKYSLAVMQPHFHFFSVQQRMHSRLLFSSADLNSLQQWNQIPFMLHGSSAHGIWSGALGSSPRGKSRDPSNFKQPPEVA